MRLFQVLNEGDFREVTTPTGRLSGVQEAVGVAAHAVKEGKFIADYGNGQVLHFDVRDGASYGVGNQNMSSVRIETTPAYITDKQNGTLKTDNSMISRGGAMYGNTKSDDIGGVNSVTELS